MKRLCALILTCEKYLDRQDAVLNTWAKDFDDYLFVSSADGEHKKSFYKSDDYADCKYKLMNAYKWLSSPNCSFEFDWIYTGDDDSFANATKMREYIGNASDDNNEIHCHTISMYDKMPNLKYPSGGAGYLCNRKTIKAITDRINIEDDIMWFDVLLGKSGIKLIHSDMLHWYFVPEDGSLKNEMSYHYVKPPAMYKLYKEMRG